MVILSEYTVLKLTPICLGSVLCFDRQILAPDHISAVWYLFLPQEKQMMYSINNLCSGSRKDDKALTVRLLQLHKYVCTCLASERKPLAGTHRLGVSTQA